MEHNFVSKRIKFECLILVLNSLFSKILEKGYVIYNILNKLYVVRHNKYFILSWRLSYNLCNMINVYRILYIINVIYYKNEIKIIVI